MLAGGQFQLLVTGSPAQQYLIETSTNLADWSALATVTNTTGSVIFSDPSPSGPVRFYRAKVVDLAP
jgi:hypothetical protein